MELYIVLFVLVVVVTVGSAMVPGYANGSKGFKVLVRVGLIAVIALVAFAVLKR